MRSLSGVDDVQMLSLADRHRRRYPFGILAQERDYLVLAATLRTGDHARACATAERLRETSNTAAYRALADSVLGSGCENNQTPRSSSGISTAR
jgi:hypothetical protein